MISSLRYILPALACCTLMDVGSSLVVHHQAAFAIPGTQPRTTHVRCNLASSISNRDLESTFYSFDADSSGEIDLEELSQALDNLGLSAPDDDIAKLFRKYDADGGGTIDFEEFKQLIADDTFSDVVPQRQISYAMNLFRKYDEDGSGSIDKNEFRALAKEMKGASTRREFISVAAAGYGAYLVTESSTVFQWFQKKFRYMYIEEQAENAQNALFPGAMLSDDVDKAIARTLRSRGFTPENTLFGHSVCSDEVNNRQEQLIPLMMNRWQEGFSLGGLGGLPFAGKSGFGAFLHHVPDSGKILVLFAPHVGIDENGRVGALQRDGQATVSSACGAAVGAYKALQKKRSAAPDPLLVLDAVKDELFDPQLEKIVEFLAPRLDGIDDSEDSIAFVTYQMYAIVRELVLACILQTPDLFDNASEVAVVGGIMINRRLGGDFFQPLSFESCRKGEPAADLFEQAFGKRPDLVPILGSENAVSALYSSKEDKKRSR